MTAKEFWELVKKNKAEDYTLFLRDENGYTRFVFEDNVIFDKKRKEIMTCHDDVDGL